MSPADPESRGCAIVIPVDVNPQDFVGRILTWTAGIPSPPPLFVNCGGVWRPGRWFQASRESASALPSDGAESRQVRHPASVRRMTWSTTRGCRQLYDLRLVRAVRLATSSRRRRSTSADNPRSMTSGRCSASALTAGSKVNLTGSRFVRFRGNMVRVMDHHNQETTKGKPICAVITRSSKVHIQSILRSFLDERCFEVPRRFDGKRPRRSLERPGSRCLAAHPQIENRRLVCLRLRPGHGPLALNLRAIRS